MAKIQPDIAMPNRIPAVSISSVSASMLLEIIMMPVAQAATANIDWHIIRLRRNFSVRGSRQLQSEAPIYCRKAAQALKDLAKPYFFCFHLC